MCAEQCCGAPFCFGGEIFEPPLLINPRHLGDWVVSSMGLLSVVWFAVAFVLVHSTVDLTNRHLAPRSPQSSLSPVRSPHDESIVLHIQASLLNVKRGEHVLFQLAPGWTTGGSVLKVSSTNAATILTGGIDEGGFFTLSCVDNTILANIQLSGDSACAYELRPLDPARQLYVVRKIAGTPRMDEHPPLTAHSHEIEGSGAQQRALLANRAPLPSVSSYNAHVTAADGSSAANYILDVMFIFTPQAYENIGGTRSAMVAFVALAVQLSNDAFANTKSPLRMRTVSIALSTDTAYVEQGFEHELVHLKDQNDGVFDTDTAARTTVGADSVVLFVASSSFCGLAYQWATTDTAFAVVSTQCPGSVAHEVGHNIGLNHDRQSLQDFNYSVGHFNFGYCWDTTSTTCSRSVMAYAGCVTSSKRTNCHSAPYFSSPDITNGALGRATGVATSDNARVLREQAGRATNWMPSTTTGGLLFSVEPNFIGVNRCEPVLISGWSLVGNRGSTTEDEIVSVTLAGAEVLRILSQDANSVTVLAQRADRGRTGDVVVTTSTGYTTTLRGAFAILETSGNFTMDFDGADAFTVYTSGGAGVNGTSTSSGNRTSSDVLWEPSGTLPWSVLRYCDAIPCNSAAAGMAELHGPLVGYGHGGNFAKLVAYDTPTSADYGAFEVLFNTDSRRGCTDLVYSVSLHYQMFTPHSECRGALSIDVLSANGVWTAVATAHVYQAKQSDPWLPLQYTFPEPAGVRGVRISAVPCSALDTCFSWSSVSIDAVTLHKSTECTRDGCDYISAYPTAAPTVKPTYRSTHGQPTAPPTSATPTTAPSSQPTLAYLPAVEHVRFQCSQTLINASAQALQADSTAAASYLLAVAEVTALPTSSLCCLTSKDPTRRTPASHTSDAFTSVTFTFELLVPQYLTVWPLPSSPGQVSPEGLVQVNRTHRLLIDSVASGRFLSAVTASLGERFRDLAVLPMTEASFTVPVSTLTVVSNSTVTPMSPEDLFRAEIGVLTWSAVVIGVLALLVVAAMWASGQVPASLLPSSQTSAAKYRIQPDLGAVVAEEEGPDSPTLRADAPYSSKNDATVREPGSLSRAYSGVGNFLTSGRESLSMPVYDNNECLGAGGGGGKRNFIPGLVEALGSSPSRGRFTLNSPSGGQYRRIAEYDEVASVDGLGTWESPAVALSVGGAFRPRRASHDRAGHAAAVGHCTPRNGVLHAHPAEARSAIAMPVRLPPPLRTCVSFSVEEESSPGSVQPQWLPARRDAAAAAVSQAGQRSLKQRSASDLGDRWIELSGGKASVAATGTGDKKVAPWSCEDPPVQTTRPRRMICAQDSPQNSAVRRVNPDALQSAPLPLAMGIPLSPRSANARSAASNFASDPWQGPAAPVLKPSHADREMPRPGPVAASWRPNADQQQYLHKQGAVEGQFTAPDRGAAMAVEHRSDRAPLPPPIQTQGLTPRHLSSNRGDPQSDAAGLALLGRFPPPHIVYPEVAQTLPLGDGGIDAL